MFTNTFYGLTDDLVFKHVFSYKFILIDFLNSYFQFTKQAKKVLRVRINTNAPINGNKRKYKIYYGDILAYLDNGEIISLEMYKRFTKKDFIKSLAYITRKFSNQFERGSNYEQPSKITSINITQHNYYHDSKNMVSDYEFIDRYTKKINDQYLGMLLLKLDKIDSVLYNKNDRLIRWLKLINARSIDEMKKISEGDEVMEQAVKFMEEFLADEEIQDMYDKITDVAEHSKEEGMIEGKKVGIRQTARKMLQDGLNIDSIAKYTGLSIPEIKELN